MKPKLKVRLGHMKDMYFAVREHRSYHAQHKCMMLARTEIVKIFMGYDACTEYVTQQNKGK